MCSLNGDESGQWRSISMTSQWSLIMTSQWVNDVVRDTHCEITMGNIVARNIHYDVTMCNDVALCTPLLCITMPNCYFNMDSME